MARAITWQDVAGPAQTPGILIAANQATRTLTDNIGGIGDAFTQIGADQKEAATGAAVAQIANAVDPMAAMAALPQQNKFIDPLAVAAATNARKEQIGQEQVRDSNLATDLLQRQNTGAELKDREDRRQGALAASEGFAFIDKNGKIPEFAKDDPLAGTTAGIYAQEAWREHLKQKQMFDIDKEKLGLERARAAREARMEKQSKAEQSYLSELNDLALKPDNFNLEPGARAKLNMEVAKKWGVGHLALKGDEHFGNAIKSNLPTQAQLDTTDENGFNRLDVITGFEAAKTDIDAKKNIELSKFKTAQEVALQSAKSTYKGLTEDQMQAKFLEDHSGELNDGWWGSKWEAKDVGQRADAIERLAKKKGFDIERHDAIEMVAATIGEMSFADGEWSVDGPEVQAMLTRYGEFADYGSVENLQLKMTNIEKQYASEAAKVDLAINSTKRSAVSGEPIDTEIAKQFENTPAAKAASLEKEVDTLKAAYAEALMIPYGTKGRDEKTSKIARQLQGAEARLKKTPSPATTGPEGSW